LTRWLVGKALLQFLHLVFIFCHLLQATHFVQLLFQAIFFKLGSRLGTGRVALLVWISDVLSPVCYTAMSAVDQTACAWDGQYQAGEARCICEK